MRGIIADTYGRLRSSLQPLDIRNQSERTKALFAVGIVSIFWGTTWLASKRGVAHMPALQLSGFRQLIGGGIYLLFFFIKGYKLPTREQLIQFTWMGLLMFVISNGFSTWSVRFIPSGLASVLGAISPLWIALFGTWFFKESRINLLTLVGLLMGFAGIVVIFYEYLSDLMNPDFITGILLGTTATMTWALGTLFTVKHAKGTDPYYSLGWQMFISGIILTLVAYGSGQTIPISSAPVAVWGSIAYLVIVGSIITFAAFIYSLKRLPAAQASVYAYINPIVALIIGALLNNEKLTWLIFIGTLITIGGIYMVNTGYRKSVK